MKYGVFKFKDGAIEKLLHVFETEWEAQSFIDAAKAEAGLPWHEHKTFLTIALDDRAEVTGKIEYDSGLNAYLSDIKRLLKSLDIAKAWEAAVKGKGGDEAGRLIMSSKYFPKSGRTLARAAYRWKSWLSIGPLPTNKQLKQFGYVFEGELISEYFLDGRRPERFFLVTKDRLIRLKHEKIRSGYRLYCPKSNDHIDVTYTG